MKLTLSGNNSLSQERFSVSITADGKQEPPEVFEVVLVCEMNCFLPQEVYTITIVNDGKRMKRCDTS